MSDKKDPGRFTVRFNAADPQHLAVIELLNQQGRYKAQFLVNAVLHYIHCPETPDVQVKPAASSAEIESIVRNVLAQHKVEPQSLEPSQTDAVPAEPAESTHNGLLEDADREAVLKTLESFRAK